MTLHLVKLCVGVSDIAELQAWVADEFKSGRQLDHITRMHPKREGELLKAGSLYWVIRGMVSCRQNIEGLESVQSHDGIQRCRILLKPKVVLVRPVPRRPFQGWRYLEAADAPPDLTKGTAGSAAMPEELRRELAALGLL